MSYIAVLLIGISLSLDAFGVSLSYGTMNFKFKKILLVSLIVGLFHYIMPIIGYFFGNKLSEYIIINPKYIISIIFLLIILEMIKSLKEEKVEKNLSLIKIFLFALAVSIDSFSVGISLAFFNNSIFICALIFSVCSYMFTFFGFISGKICNNKIGIYSKILGILLLTFLTIFFVVTN